MAKTKDTPAAPTFGSRLTVLIAEAGITRYRLAQMTGLDQSFLARLEADAMSPSLRSARAIARAFGRGLDVWNECTDE